MNFNHLLIFHKVAEKRHFTHAAEELSISQPAVSKQIHELEKTLGQPLFTHMGRSIYLTEAGQLLYDYANRIFALSSEAEAALEEMHDLARGRLAIGASTTIGTYLLPEQLGHYRTQYPRIQLSLDITNADEVQKRLREHRIEIGLVEGMVKDSDFVKQVWRQDELVLIASPQYPLVRDNEQVSLQSLLDKNVPFIRREQGSGTRAVLEEALAARGLRPLPTSMELGSTEAIKRAVAAGLGVSFVSEHTIGLELAAGHLRRVPLTDFTLTRPLFIIFPRQRRLSRAAQAFLQLIQ
jgi:DNA-binding transcriptional LysR family regulator